MTTETKSQAYQSELDALFAKRSFSKSQRKAQAALQKLGLPKRKSERYQYLPLAKVLEYSPAQVLSHPLESLPACFSEKTPNRILFYNGELVGPSSSLNIEGAKVLTMQEAQVQFAPYLDGRLSKSYQQEGDAFALVNQSLADNGIFIYLPPSASMTQPLHIQHYVDAAKGSVLPSVYIFLGSKAKMQVVQETIVHEDSSAFVNGYLDVHLDRESSLELFSTQSATKSSWILQAYRATVKQDAHLNSTDLSLNGNCRSDYHVSLLETGANASLNGAWALAGNEQTHAHIHMEHAAEGCTSNQLFKGVLLDRARSSFEGKIYVHPQAQQTESYQANHNLLLSDHAFAASKPNLEIFADDVKASHGSTVGQLDATQLFYLRSRGISEDQAKKLLIQSFLREILDPLVAKGMCSPETTQKMLFKLSARL